MRHIVFLIFFTFSILACNQGKPLSEKPLIEKPGVDKRIELVSIVFRLAGNDEYNSEVFKLYTDRINQHFSSYKDHELIQFARKMRNENGISYEAPMSLAIFLDEDMNLLGKIPDDPLNRWRKDNIIEFVRLLKKFYTDAKCDEFFNNNQELYKIVSDRFESVYKDLDLDWYSAFYGNKSNENFTISIALGNGAGSYGPSYIDSDGNKVVYAVLGVWEMDNSGLPVFKEFIYLNTLIHEFNHSFVNHLLEKNKEIFRDNGTEIFEALRYEMSQQAYSGWEIVLNEALVRASVIKYFKDHGYKQSDIDTMLKTESNNGFIWIKELVAELEKYDADRATYPTLESYMPKLAEVYNNYAKIVRDFDAKRPNVVSIEEFENGDTNVAANIKTITINFDRKLSGNGYSIFLGKKGQPAYPKVNHVRFINENKSVVMEVQLDADKEYQFLLTGKSFKTSDGFALKTYEINFKTKK